MGMPFDHCNVGLYFKVSQFGLEALQLSLTKHFRFLVIKKISDLSKCIYPFRFHQT